MTRIQIFLICCLLSPRLLAAPFDLLETGTWAAYGPEIKTVGQAVLYVLEPTGYKLALGVPAPASSTAIAMRPIPPKAQQDKVIPIYEALLLLIGDNSRLVIDTKHKLISFELF